MSLIQKALEKAGGSSQKTVSLETFLEELDEQSFPPPNKKMPPVIKKIKSPRNYFHPLLFLVLILVLIGEAGVCYLIWPRSEKSPVQPSPNLLKRSATVEPPAPVAAPVPPPVPVNPLPAVTAMDASGPLPFLGSRLAVKKPEFILTGITKNGSEWFAIINNKVVKVGEEVDHAVSVKDIREKIVILKTEDEDIRLKL